MLAFRCQTLEAEGINDFPALKTDNVGNGFIRSAIGALSGGQTRLYKISLFFAYKYLNFALFNSELRIPNYELTLQTPNYFFTAPLCLSLLLIKVLHIFLKAHIKTIHFLCGVYADKAVMPRFVNNACN